MKRFAKCLAAFAFALMAGNSCLAATIQVPQWYKLKACFDDVPVLEKPIKVKVELEAVIGDLKDARFKLLLPEKWTCEPKEADIKSVLEGKTGTVEFNVVPKTELIQGSVVVETTFATPKDSICAAIDKLTQDKNAADGMKSDVKSWPDPTKRYADISFAILPEEVFYPLTGDMWVSYDDELAPAEGFRGPVYYHNQLISSHQAQIDVEMFNKLVALLKSDSAMASKLAENGIDIEKKRFDYINGLYVLAVDALKNNDYQNALGLLEQLDNAIEESKNKFVENLKISSANIRGLVFWHQGQKRLAEEAFKKAFYQNRKHKLQRYVLRNIGLLMYANKDKATAEQMYNLALGFKKGYLLLEKEKSFLAK